MSVFLSSTERQQRIIDLLNRQMRLSVSEICQEFSISEATVRRDLEVLAAQRKIQRVHGGAIPIRHATPESPIMERSQEQAEEKKWIGYCAAGLVEDGETVFLGSGTTVLEVAKNLLERQSLTVITNSLPVINLFVGMPEISVIALGGMLRDTELSFIGHITEQALTQVRADKVFLGIRALSLEHGLTNDYLPETLTDRAILGIGGEVILVVDHTKCGIVSTAFLAPLTSIHKLVTDAQVDKDFILAVQKQGIHTLIASEAKCC